MNYLLFSGDLQAKHPSDRKEQVVYTYPPRQALVDLKEGARKKNRTLSSLNGIPRKQAKHPSDRKKQVVYTYPPRQTLVDLSEGARQKQNIILRV